MVIPIDLDAISLMLIQPNVIALTTQLFILLNANAPIAPLPIQPYPMPCTNPPTPHSANKHIEFQKNRSGCSMGITCVKRTYFSANKIMA